MKPISKTLEQPVIRRGLELVLLDIERCPASPGTRKAKRRVKGSLEMLPRARVHSRRLREREQVRLQESWAALGALPSKRAEISEALLRVLIMTTAGDATVTGPRPALKAGADIRPWLVDRQHVAGFLFELAPHLAKAVRRLDLEDGILNHTVAADFVPDRARDWCPDPRVLAQSGVASELRRYRLSGVFTHALLPFLQQASALQLEQMDRWFSMLKLSEERELCALLAHWCASAPCCGTVLSWLELIHAEPARRRPLLTEALTDTVGLSAVKPDRRLRSALRMLKELAEPKPDVIQEYAEITALLAGVAAGASPRYAVEGLALSRRLERGMPRHILAGTTFPHRRVVEFLIENNERCLVLTLWRKCAVRPGLAEWVNGLPLKRYRAADIAELIRCVSGGPIAGFDWQSLCECLEELTEGYFSVRVGHRIDYSYFIDAFRDDAALRLSSEIRGAFFELGAQLTQGGAGGSEELASAVGGLVLAADACGRLRTLCAFKDSVFRRLVKVCASENRGSLMEDGMGHLQAHDSLLVVNAFGTQPQMLLDFCRDLGAVPLRLALAVMESWKRHPLAVLDIEKMTDREAIVLLDGIAQARGITVVPRALRDHAAGLKKLRNDRLQARRAELLAGACRLQLTVLSELLEAELARSATGSRSAELPRHTLLFTHDIDANKRSMRRYLKSRVCSGGDDDRLGHPNNRRWLSLHMSRIDVPVWLGDFDLKTSTESCGDITISIEQDPDELLRMGSYVGSCLGLGGMYSSSAVAALLDANKRVVYARNRRGRVVGRQLLAISEEPKLVCFDVYPSAAPKDLQNEMAKFDRGFADALGLRVHAAEDSYDVRPLVAREWYDDGAWDLQVE